MQSLKGNVQSDLHNSAWILSGTHFSNSPLSLLFGILFLECPDMLHAVMRQQQFAVSGGVAAAHCCACQSAAGVGRGARAVAAALET